VDKIVCNNDQQASIFLQQKLKVGTTEQKYDIVEAIVSQAYPLMINRFGNFLVQRCFEHGSSEQVVAIANAIRGHTLSLSMDPFGCHVIQKAFDCVPEEHKAVMVRELLCRIPETVIHRYACHVWQKLFELRWSGEPPQVMAKVNEALRGMWHEVALGETGSLVVQNIFENCVEEEKVRNPDVISLFSPTLHCTPPPPPMTRSMECERVLTTRSGPRLKKFSGRSTSLHAVNSATGAFSIFVSMVYLTTKAAPSRMFFILL